MPRTVLVTGATGKTGEHAINALRHGGHHVRALVRRTDERSEKLASTGVEVVLGNLQDLDSVSRAAAGVDAAYFVYPVAPGLLDAAATFLEAAEKNGVSAIVNMSQLSARRDAVSNAARHHWVAERLLDHFGGGVTHLRPTLFAEWLISIFDQTSGQLKLPFNDARHAPIASEDLGRVIAAVLADPEPHAGKSYTLFGPVELNHYQIAEIMGRTLGREVTYVPVELDAFQATLEKRGADPFFVQHMVNISLDYRNGVFAGTNDEVRRLTGTSPMTVETFIERNKQFFEDSASWNRR